MKKILVLSVFLILGVVLFLPNAVNATTSTEYIDTLSNIKYLLDEKTKTATVIGYEVPTIEDITIPSKIIKGGYEYTVTKIEDLAFVQCNTVESITIPKTVISIGEKVFNRCDNLKEINVENENIIYCSEDGVLFNYNKTELIRYPEGKSDTTYWIPDVAQIADLAFWRNKSLEFVGFPNSVVKIGGNAFQFCSSLESVSIPEGVTIIEDFTFEGCTSLTDVVFNGKITKIGDYAFYGCEAITNLEIPDSVIYIGRNAFYNSTLDNKIYNVTNSLSNINSSNMKNFIRIDEDSYKTKLIANEGYKLPQNISIKIDIMELSVSDYEYDFITGDLEIPIDKINGNVEIEAIGNKMHKLSFDANAGKFSEGNNTLKFDDAEEVDFDKLEIPTRDGYKFIGYYTEKVGGTSLLDVMNSEAGIQSDITFYAQWEKVYSYKYITGENQTLTLNKISSYSFKIDGDHSLFSKLIIGNLNLVKNLDYTVEEGSTIITFTETGLAKLRTLAVGTYDVIVEYSNDKEVTGKLIIEDDTTTEDNTANSGTGNTNTEDTNTGNTSTGNTNTDANNNNIPTGKNPQTGDNIVLFTVISLIAVVGIAAIIKAKKCVK